MTIHVKLKDALSLVTPEIKLAINNMTIGETAECCFTGATLKDLEQAEELGRALRDQLGLHNTNLRVAAISLLDVLLVVLRIQMAYDQQYDKSKSEMN